MRIPSGVTDQYLYFVAVDAADFTTRETDVSGFVVYRSRNGGAAAAMTTPTINQTDSTNMPGVYELLLDEDTTIDAGDQSQEMVFHITSTDGHMAPVTRSIELYRSDVTLGTTLSVNSSGIPDSLATVTDGLDALATGGGITVPDLLATANTSLSTATTGINALEVSAATATTGINALEVSAATATTGINALQVGVATATDSLQALATGGGVAVPDLLANIDASVSTATDSLHALATGGGTTLPDLLASIATGVATATDSLDALATGGGTAVPDLLANLDTGLATATDSISQLLVQMQTATSGISDIYHQTATGGVVADSLGSSAISSLLTTQMTESYAANGTAPTLAQALFAIHQALMDFSISNTSWTVRQLDSSTTAFTITLDSATAPTSTSRS